MSMENAILDFAGAVRELSAAIKEMNAGRAGALALPDSTGSLSEADAAAARQRTREIEAKAQAPAVDGKKNVQAEQRPAEPAAQTKSEVVAPSDELDSAVGKVEDAAKEEAKPLDYAADVKPVLLKVAKKERQALVDLLKKYGAKNGEALKVTDYAAIVADANTLLAA